MQPTPSGPAQRVDHNDSQLPQSASQEVAIPRDSDADALPALPKGILKSGNSSKGLFSSSYSESRRTRSAMSSLDLFSRPRFSDSSLGTKHVSFHSSERELCR